MEGSVPYKSELSEVPKKKIVVVARSKLQLTWWTCPPVLEFGASWLEFCAVLSGAACARSAADVLTCLCAAGKPRVGDGAPVHPNAGRRGHHRQAGPTHQTAVALCWSFDQGEQLVEILMGIELLLFNRKGFEHCRSAALQIAPAEGMDPKHRMVIIVGPPEAQFKVSHQL